LETESKYSGSANGLYLLAILLTRETLNFYAQIGAANVLLNLSMIGGHLIF